VVATSSPEAFAEELAASLAQWKTLIRELGLAAE
jgi:hypothetical protein